MIDPATYRQHIEIIYRDLLNTILPGWQDDPHMADTPARVARWWIELLTPSTAELTAFPVAGVDQMVVVSGIDTWSLCAHHLLPFSATIAIGYIPDGRLLGLSKFARIAHAQAAKPTTQEELVTAIADEVQAATGTESVAVTASGLHLCMAMRGIRTPATMTTSVTRGAFRADPASRGEWFALTRNE